MLRSFIYQDSIAKTEEECQNVEISKFKVRVDIDYLIEYDIAKSADN
jgi:hypothetical protein